MVATWFTALALLAASPKGPAPIKIAVLEIKALDPTLKNSVELLQEVILGDLTKTGRIDAIGQSDVAAMVGLERQKQLLGCSDSGSSCLAELGGALGADYVLLGSVAPVEKERRVDLKLLDVRKNRVLAREFDNAPTDGALVGTTRRLLANLIKAIPGMEKVEVAPAPVKIPWPAIALGTGAAAMAAGGGYAGWTTASYYDKRAGLTVTEGQGYDFRKNVGLGILGAGAALAIAGAVFQFLPASGQTALVPALVPIDGGAMLVFGGAR